MSDYINRNELEKFIQNGLNNPEKEKAFGNDVIQIMAEVHYMAASDVKPVIHAKWEECDYIEPCAHGFGTIRHERAGLKCTNCVHVFSKKLLWENNFCPNCGARMDAE